MQAPTNTGWVEWWQSDAKNETNKVSEAGTETEKGLCIERVMNMFWWEDELNTDGQDDEEPSHLINENIRWKVLQGIYHLHRPERVRSRSHSTLPLHDMSIA